VRAGAGNALTYVMSAHLRESRPSLYFELSLRPELIFSKFVGELEWAMVSEYIGSNAIN
jgi:hypothetical protein